MNLGLFWWAPRRSVALLRPEARPNGRAWARLALRSGRPLLNFGDELSRHVVSEVAGLPVRWRRAAQADLVSIGSIFELAARDPGRAAIWGTGLREEPAAEVAARMLANVGPVLAVRGPRTRAALGLPPDLPLGDPGLLAFRHVTRSPQPRGMLVIPHFTQWNHAAGRRQIAGAARAGFTVVDPSQSPARVLAEIARASFVTSASLHGVIVAHALGVPAELVRDTGSKEPTWKYEDYAASLDFPLTWSTWEDLRQPATVDRLKNRSSDHAPRIAARAHELGDGLVRALRSWLAIARDPASPILAQVDR